GGGGAQPAQRGAHLRHRLPLQRRQRGRVPLRGDQRLVEVERAELGQRAVRRAGREAIREGVHEVGGEDGPLRMGVVDGGQRLAQRGGGGVQVAGSAGQEPSGELVCGRAHGERDHTLGPFPAWKRPSPPPAARTRTRWSPCCRGGWANPPGPAWSGTWTDAPTAGGSARRWCEAKSRRRSPPPSPEARSAWAPPRCGWCTRTGRRWSRAPRWGGTSSRRSWGRAGWACTTRTG